MLRHTRRSSSRSRTNDRWRWVAWISTLVLLAATLPMPLLQPAPASARQGTERVFTWIVEKRECPPGFDPATADGATAFNTCPTAAGTPFTLSSDNPNYPGDTRTSGDSGPGRASWTELPANTTYTVSEQVPAGYGQPNIRCGLFADPNDPSQGSGNPGFSVNGGSVSAFLPADSFVGQSTVLCRFYNVPPPPQGETQPTAAPVEIQSALGGIQIRKYTCLLGLNEADLTYQALVDRCTGNLAGVQFTVTVGLSQPQTITTNNDGDAFFSNYPGGPVSILEQDAAWPHPMKPIVYCTVDPGRSASAAPPELAEVEPDGRVSFNLESGQSISCTWFNTYRHTGVQLLKLSCPDDIDPENSDLPLLRERCEPQPGVTFDVEIDGETGDAATTGATQADGRMPPTLLSTSNPSPVYETTILETMPDGFVNSRIFCSVVRKGQHPAPIVEVQLSSTNLLAFQQPWETSAACAWFNFRPYLNGDTQQDSSTAPQAFGEVLVQKYLCPESIPIGDSYGDHIDVCQNSESGASFNFTVIAGAYNYQVPRTTDPSGRAEWLDVPAATIELRENNTPGYRARKVYCGTVPISEEAEPGVFAEVPLAGPSIVYELPEGARLICKWFNEPDNGETQIDIALHKFVCPVGYDPYATNDIDAARAECSAPQGGVTFGLEEAGYAATEAQTDINGNAFLSYFGGEATLYEIPPFGYRTGALYCSLDTGSGPGTHQRTNATPDDRYPIQAGGVPLGTLVDCYWFNAPLDGEAADVTIAIHKYVCPAGYDPHAADDVDAARAACTEPQGGVTFGMEEAGYPTTEVQTDESGSASLPYNRGAATLYELPPAGYQTAALYCSVDSGSGPEPYQRSDLMPDNRYPILASGLPVGTSISCYWFNAATEIDEPVGEEPGRVDIRKYVCPTGYDYETADLAMLVEACGAAPQEGVEFYADDANGGTVDVTDSNGYVALAGLLAGPVTLYETVPDGYRPARVYCYPFETANGGPAFSEYEQMPLSEDGSINIDATAGSMIECYWFNEPYENEAGIVTVYKYLCPDGYDPPSVSRDYLLDWCNEPHTGVEYTASWNGGPAQPMMVGESGYARWEGAPGGLIEIQELVAPDYKILRVYCAAYDASMGSPNSWQSMLVSGSGRIDYDLADGYNLDCVWFNTPVDEEENGYGSVTIYKLVCPDGYDPASYSRDYLASSCTDPHAGVEFSLERQDAAAETMTVSVDGIAYWSNVPGGSITMTENGPDGYTSVGVFCDDYPIDGTPGDYQGVAVVNGATVSYQLPEGYSLTCYWYNAPYEDNAYGSVSIAKYVCPEGYDPHSVNREYLASWCMDPHEGVEFHLDREGGSSEPMTTSGTGEATWQQVHGGPLELREVPTDGYQTLRVYCAAYPTGGQPSDYQSLPVSDGTSVYFDLTPGYSLACLWYNAPVGGGWIELTKYACPESYDASSGSSMSFADSCQQRVGGVGFSLEPQMDSDGESRSATTDSTGIATFEDVRYGVSYNLIEQYPDGYDAAVVYCSRYVPHYGAMTVYEPYAVSNGAIAVSLDEGEYLTCRWYNLAAPYGAGVMLTKYACPDGAWEASGEDLADLCDTPMPHVRFYLTSGEHRIAGTTSAMGEVAWEGVTAGLARIEEVAPDGYGNRIRVYCAITMDRGSGAWQPVAIQGGVGIEYGLSDGQTLECRWYNFPIVETGAGVQVTKYLCDPNADLISVSRLSLKSRCVPLSGVQFSLATSGEPSWSRLTGPAGTARWDGVPDGEFGLAERTTSGYRAPLVYCSVNGGHYARVIVSGGSIRYHINESDDLRCEWFNVPKAHVAGPVAGSTRAGSGTGAPVVGQVPLGGDQAASGTEDTGPASLTIVSYLCPTGYDLYDVESDPRADCEAGDEPLSFTLEPWGEGANGEAVTREGQVPEPNVVTFDGLEAGDYLVSLVPPVDPDIAWAFVLGCQSSLGQSDSSRFYPLALTGDNLGLRLALYPGEDLECGWYNVPTGGTLVMVTVYECPGQVANPSRCVLASDPVVIVFFPLNDQLDTINVETGEDGTANAELAAGVYAIEDQAVTACLVDSTSMDDDGNLVVDGDETIEVVIYTCSG